MPQQMAECLCLTFKVLLYRKSACLFRFQIPVKNVTEKIREPGYPPIQISAV